MGRGYADEPGYFLAAAAAGRHAAALAGTASGSAGSRPVPAL
jgi:hypothetical protein